MENSLQAHQGSAKSNLVPIRDNLEEYEKLLAELEQVRFLSINLFFKYVFSFNIQILHAKASF